MSFKPWMNRKSGESKKAWFARLNKTCYHCGKEFPTVKQTNNHEDRCQS